MKFSSPVFVFVPQNFEFLVHVITPRRVYLLFLSVFSLSWFSALSRSRGIPAFCCLQRFFSAQQFDAALPGIAFATPICTPAVTLLLPNLLPRSLLPPAGSARKCTQLHIKFEPQLLPPAKKMCGYQPAPGFTSSWIIPLQPPLYWFSFSFSPSWWICGCFSTLFCCCSAALTVFSSKRR